MFAIRRLCPVLCALLLLASCSRPQGLPADEVLRGASRASRDLQSATFALHADIDTTSTEGRRTTGTLQAGGRMQHAGQQLQFAVNGAGESGQSGSPGAYTWSVVGDVIVVGEGEVYLSVQELATDPPDALFPSFSIPGILNQWWRLPSQETAPSPTVTPDPKLLHMQAEVVDVTRDYGFERVNGRPSYHYDVKINRDKLAAFLAQVARERGEEPHPEALKKLTDTIETAGELWIDSETFFMQALKWTVTSKDPTQPLSVQLHLSFSEFNSAEPIEPPAESQFLPINPLDGLAFPPPPAT